MAARVMTVTSTVPVPAGEVTWIWVSDMTVISPALVLPNPTSVAPVKPVPVMVTVSPRLRTPNQEISTSLRGQLHCR